MLKKRFLPFTLLLIAPFVPAQEPDVAAPEQERTGVFQFYSVEVLKEFKKEVLPVVSTSRKGVFILTEKGLKKQKFGPKGLTFRPTLARSSNFVRATDFDFELENYAAERRNDAVANVLEAGADEAQNRSDRINTASEAERQALLGPGETVDSVNADSVEAAEVADNFSNSSSRFSRASQVADTVFFDFTLVPEQDIENISAAIVFRHQIADPDGGATPAESTLLSLEKIGDLRAAEENTATFSLSFREQLMSGLSIQVYLFDGEMKPIASNLAGQLRELAPSEL